MIPKGHALGDLLQVYATHIEGENFVAISTVSPFMSCLYEIFSRSGVKPRIVVDAQTPRTCYDSSKVAGVSVVNLLIIETRDEEVIIKPFRPDINWGYTTVCTDFE